MSHKKCCACTRALITKNETTVGAIGSVETAQSAAITHTPLCTFLYKIFNIYLTRVLCT